MNIRRWVQAAGAGPVLLTIVAVSACSGATALPPARYGFRSPRIGRRLWLMVSCPR
jgi:hypothetical protein